MNPSLGATLRLFSHMNTLTRHSGKLSRVSSFHHSGQSKENSSFLHSCKWRKVSALNYNYHSCQLRKLSSSHRSQLIKVSWSHSVQSSKSFSRKFSGQNEDRDEESSPTVLLLDEIMHHFQSESSNLQAKYPYLMPTKDKTLVKDKILDKLNKNFKEVESKPLVELLESIEAYEREGATDSNLAQRCVDRFQDWSSSTTAVGVGYLLHAYNVLGSEEYMERIVKHLAKDILNLAPHEVVTLMLMIYFRKSWDETRLYKLIDPSKLQKKIAHLVEKQLLSNAEVNIIFFGLRRIKAFVDVNDPDLRHSLYERCYDIATVREQQNRSRNKLDETALTSICTILDWGKEMARDDKIDVINFVLKSFVGKLHEFEDPQTILRIVTLGRKSLCYCPELFAEFAAELPKFVDSYNINYLRRLLDFCIQREVTGSISIIETILTELRNRTTLKTRHKLVLQELSMYFDCVSWGALIGIQDETFLDKILESISSIELDGKSEEGNLIKISKSLLETFFPKLKGEEISIDYPHAATNLESIARSLHRIEYAAIMRDLEMQRNEALESMEQEQYESISCRNHLKFPPKTSDFLRKVGTRKWSSDEPAKDIKNIVKKGNKVVQSSEAFVALNPLPFLPCDMVVFGIMSGIHLPVPDYLEEDAKKGDILIAPELGYWYALETTEPRIGYPQLRDIKRRYLEKLGFTYIRAPSNNFRKLMMNLITKGSLPPEVLVTEGFKNEEVKGSNKLMKAPYFESNQPAM